MESFEHVTKVWLESKGFVVSSGVKFPVKVQTMKKSRQEFQEHGYEVDLVAARRDKLVLVNVKSYFGSKGLNLPGLTREKMFSSNRVWEGILAGACDRYGYSKGQIELWVVAGLVLPKQKTQIADFLRSFEKKSGIPTAFYDANHVARGLVTATECKTYLNDPVIATVRTIREAGLLIEKESLEPKTSPKGDRSLQAKKPQTHQSIRDDTR